MSYNTERGKYAAWKCHTYLRNRRTEGMNCGVQVKDSLIKTIVEKYLAHTKESLLHDEQSAAPKSISESCGLSLLRWSSESPTLRRWRK